MKHITKELAELLDGVSRPVDYFVSGHTALLAPRIEVEGVGPVALPLLATQAKALIKLASQAPFGRGGDTVLDTTVRRTWQIGPDRVRIGGKHWDKTLAGIVARAAEGLGVGDPIAAKFLQAADLRQRQLLRRPSGHGEVAGHVRDTGHRFAGRFGGWRTRGAPQ